MERDFRRGEVPEPARTVLKRYRLARLRFDGQAAGAGYRYEYLKRVYD